MTMFKFIQGEGHSTLGSVLPVDSYLNMSQIGVPSSANEDNADKI